MRFCRKCGEATKGSVDTCPKCGADLNVWDARRQTLKDYEEAGIGMAEVLTAGESSCKSCQALHGTRWPVWAAPVLPNPNCTHELGCRCTYIAVIGEDDSRRELGVNSQ